MAASIVAFCCLGMAIGFLLLWRVPVCVDQQVEEHEAVSVIIPARNEEANLAKLLGSLQLGSEQPTEVIVVDDGSSDRTADVARTRGAIVLTAEPLPHGWTGKTWACYQGADEAAADVLFFTDADTTFTRHGFSKVMETVSELGDPGVAVSILPYHMTREPYEQLSLFFNLLMAMGAGGFGIFGSPRLFGQALVISRDLYNASGGHKAVSGVILENFALSKRVRAAGGRCQNLSGRGVLHMRMFPHGFGQLCEGWRKAFAAGAAGSDPVVLALSIAWLSALCLAFLFTLFAPGVLHLYGALLYLTFGLQLHSFARRVGNYRLLASLLYPIPLVFYFTLFTQSLYRRMFHRSVRWRGRSV